jgi:hypothetical protein
MPRSKKADKFQLEFEKEALLERCANLILALKPFADLADYFDGRNDKEIIKPTLNVGYLRAAKKAIDDALYDYSNEKEKVK